jgi:hypothetical protein
MDDILVASTSLEGHRVAVHAILDRLEELDLYLKPEKCTWESPQVNYLGLILEKGVTRMDPAKIKGIANWPTPTTVKQVRSFLGFCNFYQPFIYHFSHIARPLNKLTRKETPWILEDRHQKAFEEVRNRVTSEPVLAQPQLDQQFKIEVDTSGFAFGAVLIQKGKDNKKHPVAYYSATAHEAECNYDIGTTGYHQSMHALATLPSRITSQSYHSYRSRKPAVLAPTAQDKPKNCKRSPGTIRI